MLNPTQLEKFSIAELIDSSNRSVQFTEAFAAQFLEMPPVSTAPTVGTRLVELATVVKLSSAVGVLACTYSLIMWSFSGFALIHPLFSLLGIIAGITFYCMGGRLRRPS